jgi:hypothetical protein
MRRLWQFLIEAAWLLWFGGLSFYMIFVVPIGGEVLGAHTQGEVTAQVTGPLNALALAAAVLIGIQAAWRGERLVLGMAVGIAATTLGLIGLRLVMLESMQTAFGPRSEADAGWSFYALHRVYLWITTAQWLAGVLILWRRSTRDSRVHWDSVDRDSVGP